MRVVIDWSLSTLFGWGIYGLNLALGFANDPDIELRTTQPVNPGALLIDPLRAQMIEKMFIPVSPNYGDVALVGLGNSIKPNPNRGELREKTIGIIFFEDPLSEDSIENAKAYGGIVCGSQWNADTLFGHKVSRVRTCIHGIDRTYFHPGPKLAEDGRFRIFSGGKSERRKGQDIVMAAFRIFAEKHPEAQLVTAWQSPWPWLARSLDKSRLCAPVEFASDRLDVKRWARTCGINPDQVMDIGQVHNCLMPQVLRQMDCAVFPNRAEGATNYVAMECMGCDVPTAVSKCTGHLNLENPWFLDVQEKDEFGRGEVSVDEVVKFMMTNYDNFPPSELARHHSIEDHCASLKSVIMGVAGRKAEAA